MADIQYLNYGDLQIELLALLNNLANQVLDYVGKQSWSNKRKEKFMSAYSDLMNRGILGASNSTGQWVLNVGGDSPVPLDTMSRKDREMYQEAAYFIQQQMASLPTKASLEEKEEIDKSKLPIFDHSTFKKGFLNQVSNDYFGGSNEIKTSSWDEYDKRDDKGIRGRTERAKMLIDSLERYALNLELNKDKYNFEGSPFGSLDELKNRIAAARKALIETPDDTDDDFKALNALGLNASEWFNNGSGDPSGQYIKLADGTLRLLSYAELNEYNLELAKIKEEENAKLLKKKLQEAYNNTLFLNRVTNPKMLGWNPEALKEKYKDGNSLLAALQGYALKDIRTLTPDELSEVHGAYKSLANEPIDNDLFNKIKNSSSGLYKNAAPNRFRKIRGIDNLIWDSIAKLVIQINTRQLQLAVLNLPLDLFSSVKTKQEKENEYFNNPDDGFTDADRRELEAIALDLTAMFDPTRVYGTAAGLTASGLRTYNRWNDADGFTLSDLGASALDVGLNGILWLPGIGNVANGAKGILSLAKFAPKIGRLIGRAGAAGGMIYGITGLPEVWNKIDFAHPIDSAKRLTVEDWRKLSALMAGIKGTRDLNVTNRAARRTLEQNDIQISNRWSDKLGLTSTKMKSEVSTPMVRMKVGEKEVNIPIEEKVLKNLSKKLNKKGNNSEERSKVAREDTELLKAAEKAGIKVKDKDGNLTEEWKNASVTYEPSWRDKTFFGKQIPLLSKNSGTFGVTPSQATNIGNPLKFLDYLNNRGLLDKAWYGSNTTLRRMNNELGINFVQQNTSNNSSKKQSNNSNNNLNSDRKIPHSGNEIRADWKNTIERKLFTNNKLSKDADNYSIGNKKDSNLNIDFQLGTADNKGFRTLKINFGDKTTSELRFQNLKELQQKIAKVLLDMKTKADNLKSGIKRKELGKILQDLKRKGWLREGGKIDKQRIQKYKEFINK